MAGTPHEREKRELPKTIELNINAPARIVLVEGDRRIAIEVTRNFDISHTDESFRPTPENLIALADYEQTCAHLLTASSVLERTRRSEFPAGDTIAQENVNLPIATATEQDGSFRDKTIRLNEELQVPLWKTQEYIRRSRLLLPTLGATLGAHDPSVTQKVDWLENEAANIYNGVENPQNIK